MTREEKAKAYDKAIEKIKYVMEHGVSPVLNKEDLQDIFPELQENEDEKVKRILHSISSKMSFHLRDIFTEEEFQCFDAWSNVWLEKQVESDETKAKIFLINKGYPVDANGVFPTYEEMYNIIIEGLEHQGFKSQDKSTFEVIKEEKTDNQNYVKPVDKVEPKFKVGDTMRTLQEASNGITNGMPVVASIDNEYYHCTNELIAIKDQDDYEFPPINMKQNLADKVEPKFKVGDWVVTDKGDTIQIGAVNSGYYTIDNGMDFSTSYVDKYWHLWTIQDAKDGDILFHSDSASNGIFIFKELLKYEFGEKVICYCDYDSEDHFCLGEHHTCCWTDAKILHPATKEQRKLLFSKMKEAGYEWNEEKKELRKIEQKPKWNEEDEKILMHIIQDVELLLGDEDERFKDERRQSLVWLKSLKQRMEEQQ